MSQTRDGLPSPGQELLLRAALLDGPDAVAAWTAWRRSPVLDPGSERLLPLVYRSLERHGSAPPALASAYRKTWSQNRLRLHELGATVAALAAEGIETLLLKGGALLLVAYGDYGARPMSDLDLLVRRPQAGRALATLAGLGYHSPLGRAEALVGLRHGDELVDGAGRRIDLHWHALQEACWPGADDRFWEGSVELEDGGLVTRTLCPADQLLHVLVHGARWSATQPVAWVADATALIRAQSGTLDWERLVAEAAARRVTTPVAFSLAYLARTFAPEIPPATLQALGAAPATRRERLEQRIKRRPHRLLGTLPLLWLDWRRLAERTQAPPGFLRYLQVTFRLTSRRQLPATMARLAWRRLSSRASPRGGIAPGGAGRS
jgi:hypothetical protein